MKYFYLLSVSLLLQFTLSAQGKERIMEDVIYLLDGSVLKGELMKYEKGESATILLKSGQEVEVKDADIERIVQEKRINPNKRNPLKTGNLYYAFYFSGNFGNNLFEEGDWGMGIEHVTGIWLSENLGLGLGGGILQFSTDYNWRVVPIFLDVKYKSTERSPYYLSGDVGLGIPLKNENQGIHSGDTGERLRFGIGRIWTTKSMSRLSLEISYLRQNASFERETWRGWNEDITTRNITFNRYQFRFGVLF